MLTCDEDTKVTKRSVDRRSDRSDPARGQRHHCSIGLHLCKYQQKSANERKRYKTRAKTKQVTANRQARLSLFRHESIRKVKKHIDFIE